MSRLKHGEGIHNPRPAKAKCENNLAKSDYCIAQITTLRRSPSGPTE
jgi:hypothetical protein